MTDTADLNALAPEPPDFQAWHQALVRIAPEYVGTLWDDWESFFTEGLTPQQAVDEDRSHGD